MSLGIMFIIGNIFITIIKTIILGVISAKTLQYFVLAFGGADLNLSDYIFFSALIVLIILFIIEIRKNAKFVPKILGMSALIDGRVLKFYDEHILEGKILVPYFIIKKIRDDLKSKDHKLIVNAQQALSTLEELKIRKGIKVVFKNFKAKDLNDKLIKAAAYYKATLITTSFTVSARASRVINISEFINSIDTEAVPGQSIVVYLVRGGKNKEDAVGYLNDGSIVIAAGARSFISKKVLITIDNVVVNIYGRKIFGNVLEALEDKT